MTQYKRCLTLALVSVLLTVGFSGCFRTDDIGAAILVEPASLDFGTDAQTLTLSLAKNVSSTSQGPITIVPLQPWLMVSDCLSADDNCLSANPFDHVQVEVTVDRSRMELGENEGTLFIYASNSPVAEVTVTATDVLKASFSANVRRVEIGEAINFTNLSETTDAAGPVISQEWDFGDGASSALQNVNNKIYSAPGHYDVSLTVRTATMEETLTRVAFVSVGDVLPLVDFAADQTVIVERGGVQFTDMTKLSDRPDADLTDFIEAWHWDFGDGTTSDKASPVHQYTAVGNYTVTLTVQTPFGAYSATKEEFIHVQRRLGPTADFFMPDSPLPIRQPVQFTDLSDPGSDPITQWLWEFGDGTSSNLQDPTHTYTEAGTVDVKLTVSNANGSSSTVQSLTLQYQPPRADFEANDLTPAVGQAVQFTDLSVPGSDPIMEWRWSFGDGTTSTDREPQHTYTQATGQPLTVTLTVRSSAPAPANSDTETKTAYIMVYDPPEVAFDIDLTEAYGRGASDNMSVITGDPVSFINQSVAGTEDEVAYFWQFGDGATSTDESPDHTYAQPGIYTVRLTASTDTQFQQTQRIVTVDSPPTADFSATPRTVIAGATVQFTDLSTPGQVPVVGQAQPVNGSITAWLWDFGDGESSSERNPSHIFPLPDQYSVNLTAYFRHSSSGATLQVSASKANYIAILQPADLVVDTLNDTLDGNTQSVAHLLAEKGDDGRVSLREAIEATNNQPGAESILFSVEGIIYPEGDLPTITGEGTTILGEGRITLDGSNATTAGLILAGADAYVSGLTIVNFPFVGVMLAGEGSTGNTLLGCRIGNDGGVAQRNAIGVLITEGAAGNTIGGAAEGNGNVIAGNAFQGLYIDGGGGNIVEGNHIGVDSTGLVALANDEGIFIDASSANTIGGSTAGARNLISGNDTNGVVITGAESVQNNVFGNYIGVDATGLAALGNGANGVVIDEGATLTRVGASEAGQGNVIAANGEAGVLISGVETVQNRVAGNTIGVDANLEAALGNVAAGVALLDGTTNNSVGVALAGGTNLIGGNGDAGVLLDGEGVSGNRIYNNAIGTTEAVVFAGGGKQVALAPLGNLTDGVRIAGGAAANSVGGDGDLEGNLIGFNGGDGIRIADAGSDENLVQGNEITTNEGSGILVRDGATRARIGRVLASFADTAANIIRANAVYGVSVRGAESVAVTVRANQITENGVGPVFLGEGANMGVALPEITAFAPLRGNAPPFAIVDVFTDGLDENDTILPHFIYVGSTNARLTGTFSTNALDGSLALYAGRSIYVSATDAFGNTSQYSGPVPIP